MTKLYLDNKGHYQKEKETFFYKKYLHFILNLKVIQTENQIGESRIGPLRRATKLLLLKKRELRLVALAQADCWAGGQLLMRQ